MPVISKFGEAEKQLRQRGFTMVQMLIVVAIVALVSTFGFLGIRHARADIRLKNSARRFAVHVEKARLDSIRRHAAPGGQAQVQTFAPGTAADNTFAITMDFDGTGAVQTRTFTLDEGVTFGSNAQTISFDWRGRIPQRVAFSVTNWTGAISVDVSGSGDITLGNQSFADEKIPDVAVAGAQPPVVPDPTPFPGGGFPSGDPPSDATPTPTPNGNGNGNGNGNDNGGNPHSTPTPTPQPTPTPTPTPSPDTDPDAPPPPCASSVSTNSMTLSQSASGGRSGTVSFTLVNATGSNSVTAVQAGAGNNLTISVSPGSLNGDGVATITITSKTGSGNRGDFTVNISSPTCGAVHQVIVSVGN